MLISDSGQGSASSVTKEISDASGAAVGCEEVKLEPEMTQGVTPAGLVEMVRGVLGESLVRSVGAVYQFELSGANGGTFYLDLKHGKYSVNVI